MIFLGAIAYSANKSYISSERRDSMKPHAGESETESVPLMEITVDSGSSDEE